MRRVLVGVMAVILLVGIVSMAAAAPSTSCSVGTAVTDRTVVANALSVVEKAYPAVAKRMTAATRARVQVTEQNGVQTVWVSIKPADADMAQRGQIVVYDLALFTVQGGKVTAAQTVHWKSVIEMVSTDLATGAVKSIEGKNKLDKVPKAQGQVGADSGCWWCTEWTSGGGYVDSDCQWSCGLACAALKVPAAIVTCEIGCRTACYVPYYEYCTHNEWHNNCPTDE